MATHGGPNIVDDGLVFYVDAANPRSYPGSGTTVQSIVSSDVGTMEASGMYDSTNAGVFAFDGGDDWIDVPNSTGLNMTTNATWNWWHNFSNIIEIQCFASRWDSGQLSWYIQKPTAQNIEFNIKPSGATYSYNLFPISGFSGVINQWYNFCFVYDGSIGTNADKLKFYVNAVQQTPGSTYGTFPNSIPVTTSKMRIGNFSDSYTTREIYGEIACFSLQTKSLSSTEVKQNFNALKGRFGI